MSTSSFTVTAIVIQYGGGAVTAGLLEELRSDVVRTVIVVRNPRHPGDASAPCPVPGGELVTLPTNRGYGAAANEGRRRVAPAEGAFVVVLTHDVDLEPGCLRALARALQADNQLAIVGPVLREEDPESCIVGGRRSLIGHAARIAQRWPIPHRPGEVRSVDWIDGAAMMIRPGATPLFDERYFLYVEELAVCLSVQPAFRVGVALDALASQRSGATARPGAHGYLIVRNSLLLDAGLHGVVGVALGLVRTGATIGRQLVHVVSNHGPGRRFAWTQVVGMTWGAFDGVRGRIGPPPSPLQRGGDIANAS